MSILIVKQNRLKYIQAVLRDCQADEFMAQKTDVIQRIEQEILVLKKEIEILQDIVTCR